ncbi:MAG: saccharopine dehydrogenase NADP-binding domain-containing protein, partial [Candidatus Lokiarchaeota archaeon]|nr:saccharopine dehydrogenase NADP-binding domain-containing protein [Candidatus Lokiarchaeota archaeon]
MSKENWLLYGAYGYTGQLIAKEAVSRGHKPILAGRSAEKLIPLANNLNLDYRVFDLTDNNLQQILAEFNLVYHAAGPYIHTSAPMVQACLKAGTNYLDLTGEIPVLEHNFKLDEQARQRQIAIISGAGFDVIPTDCLAKSVSELISNPTHLEIAIALCTETECVSPGTMKTVMEHISPDALIRKDGTLIKLPMGSGAKEIQFSDKTRTLVPTVWADLVTAYVSTGIPNITVYAPYSKSIVKMMKETKLKKDKV